MKPRLDTAPRTPEDRFIWLRLMHGKMPPLPFRTYMEADRRDADLMWLVERIRITTHGLRPLDYPHWPMVMILIRGSAAVGESWPNREPL